MDPSGNVVDFVSLVGRDDWVASLHGREDLPLLGRLPWYRDSTHFNRKQLPFVVRELELVTNLLEGDARKAAEEVLLLSKRSVRSEDLLTFVGR